MKKFIMQKFPAKLRKKDLKEAYFKCKAFADIIILNYDCFGANPDLKYDSLFLNMIKFYLLLNKPLKRKIKHKVFKLF